MYAYYFLMAMVIPLTYQFPQDVSSVENILRDCNYRETTDASRGICHKKALQAAKDSLDKGRSGSIGPVVLEPTFFGKLKASLKEGTIFFDINARDMKGRGLSQFTVDNAKVNCATNTVDLDLSAKEVALEGLYDLAGQLLLIHLTGSGDCTAVLKNVQMKMNVDLEKRSVGGKEIMAISSSPKTSFTMDGWKTHFRNLDIDDPILDESFHHFIDNNYNLVIPQVAGTVNEVLGREIGKYLGELYKVFPADLMC